MATEIAVRFPFGRYHATPWGRSPNEGLVEWPPSPWRLCRALYAVWRDRRPHLDVDDVRQVLELVATSPSYAFPDKYTHGHTRHYMPTYGFHPLTKPGEKVKMLDTFVVLPPNDELRIRWQNELSDGPRQTLRQLVEALPWLGRAESFCEARLADDDARRVRTWWGPVSESAADSSEDALHTKLLVPELPLDLDMLTVVPTALRRAGYLSPPGAKWVEYMVPKPAVPDVAHGSTAVSDRPEPTTAMLVLDGPVASSVYATTAVADVVRSAAMSMAEKLTGSQSSQIVGKTTNGDPLTGHQHAHFLPLDTTGNQMIDRVLVWAPGGLGTEAVAALSSLRKIYAAAHVKGVHAQRTALEALGEVEDVLKGLSKLSLLGPSESWRTLTPFAPPHRRKRQDRDEFVAQQVRRECGFRGLPEPVEVAVDDRSDALQFRRRRMSQHLEQNRPAFHVRARFAEPVRGPVSLGALSHFGLGLFEPLG